MCLKHKALQAGQGTVLDKAIKEVLKVIYETQPKEF